MNCFLHPFDGEEGSEVGGECGEHEDDEQPVGGHEHAAGQGLEEEEEG